VLAAPEPLEAEIDCWPTDWIRTPISTRSA
jgi:hypothetical protein